MLVRLQRLDDAFVIHFGTEQPRINAYTLATTLSNLADAAKAANAAINPGYEIEIVVEALASGSFRTQIRAFYRRSGNLFSGDSAKQIVLNVIASVIFQYSLATDGNVVVTVDPAEVVIEQGDTRVVVPREVHDAAQAAERSPQFRKSVSEAMRGLEDDAEIKSLGFSYRLTDREPLLMIPRERFAILPRHFGEEEQEARDLIEVTDVQILRAILERSKRRWEFVWHGVRIAAPVTDDRFYDDFIAHRVTIAPGDMLRVRLRVKQRRHKEARMFINESYEVVKVISHLPQPTQGRFDSTDGHSRR